MPTIRLFIAWFLVLNSAAIARGQPPLRSGPQPKQEILTFFRPLNLNGEFAGEPHCLVCENGLHPVVMVFARDHSAALAKLLAQLEAATAKHKGDRLGAFVVFLKDGEEFRGELERAAKAMKLQNVILSIEEPAVVDDYKLAQDAELTVVLYNKSVVAANHAFRKGELNEQKSASILADIAKILPAKEK